MRYLAIDYGLKRVGLAVCDAEERIVSPLRVLKAHGGLIRAILDIVERENAEAIVLGLPLNMDGTEGMGVKTVRRFSKELQNQVNIPIYLQDERLSTFDAEAKLSGIGLSRKKKKKHLDSVAAASILQSFLDEKHAD